MDLKTFLENFDAIAEAPGGIPKLRSLILGLAVRGKLVPQNPEDKPASVLVEKIRFKKEQLIKEKKIRQSDSLPPVELEEMSHELPNGWEWIRFGDATICRDGERIPLSREQRTLRQGEYDYYGASGVIDKIDDYLFDEPLLLIGEDGANLVNRSTPIAFIASGKYWVNNHAHVLDSLSVDCLRYFEVFINAIDLKPYITGTAQPKMNQAKMNSIPVPLPPLAEQKRIVEKVDELMALCDRYEVAKQTRDNLRQKLRGSAIASLMNSETDEELDAAWAFVRDNWQNLSKNPGDVGSLRKTILQLAVRGRLVPQNTDDETLDALLTKAKQYQPKYKPTEKDYIADTINEAYFTFYELPLSWQWVRLRELSSSMTNGLYKPARFYSDKGIASIRMFNIQNGHLLLNQLKRVETTEEEYSTYQLSWGDIIVNRVNSRELVGKAAIVDVVNEPMVYEAMNIRVKLIPGVTFPHYINLVLLNENSRQLFFNVAKQASGQASISQPQVGSLPIPLPPLAEQKRIVAKVDELMQLCDQLEASLRQSQQRAESLVASAISHLTI
jgi:type I restriction enzyme S subunit